MLETVRSNPAPSLPDTPFSLALITIPKQDYINQKQQANYWQSQYRRVSAREKEGRASARATIDQLKKEHKNSLIDYEAQIKELKSRMLICSICYLVDPQRRKAKPNIIQSNNSHTTVD